MSGMSNGIFSQFIYLFLNLNIIRNVENKRVCASKAIPFKQNRVSDTNSVVRVYEKHRNMSFKRRSSTTEHTPKKLYLCFATVSSNLISQINATHFVSPFLRGHCAIFYLLILYACLCFSLLLHCSNEWARASRRLMTTPQWVHLLS